MSATLHPPLQLPFAPATRFDAGPALRRSRRTAITVACAHVLVLWALLQSEVVRESVHELAPVIVRLVSAERPAPTPQPLPLPPRPVQPPAPLLAPPELPAIQLPPAEPAPALPPPQQAPAAVRAEPVASVPAPTAPPAPPPPARKQLSTTALRYLVEPPVELPRASRRAGEQGTVWLRVVVGTQGLPLQVSVQRSSGHARLDEQALWAMRQARFQPYTEDGRALEVEAVAVIEYVLD
ncbi:MAG: energy transducer TonB [Rubrivivax sp.]|nr:energy transducer TonB [Rubrivivax sp.]